VAGQAGEISLSTASYIRLPLGAKLTVVSAPGRPVLTIVGYGDEQVNPEDAWVVPGEIAALRAPGPRPRSRCSTRSPMPALPSSSAPTWLS
jgi:hypothetical protein